MNLPITVVLTDAEQQALSRMTDDPQAWADTLLRRTIGVEARNIEKRYVRARGAAGARVDFNGTDDAVAKAFAEGVVKPFSKGNGNGKDNGVNVTAR